MPEKTKKKFNRDDFVFENSWFESLIKMPGSLQMQQFQIADCEQCKILIFDGNAGVFVDDCKFCHLFVGPSQSSIFIRNCHYMNIVCLSQQFRVRDSTNCKIWLWCESQPIIQSSHHLQFYPFEPSLGYAQLEQQMRLANLKLWNNNWFDIYDFTPVKYQMRNFQLCSSSPKQQQILNLFKSARQQAKLKANQMFIPACQGRKHIQQNGPGSYAVVYISPVPKQGIGLPVLHSRTSRCPDQLASQIKESVSSKLALFAKVKTPEAGRWKNWGQKNSAYTVQIITQGKHKQILDSTVFVPFADER